jgi:hypothetical protein
MCCAAGPAAAALRFDGTDDYVSLGVAPGLGATNFTIECWMKRQGPGAATSTGTGGINGIPLVTKGRAENEAGVTNMNYFLGLGTNNTLMADFEDKNNGLNHPITATSNLLVSNLWQHVAATYSVNNSNWVFYLNGLPITTGVVNGALLVRTPERDSIQPAALGSALTTAGAAAGFFAGSLEEVRIWNYARSAAEIAANKDQRIPSAAGLIGRWPLTETSGTSATDTAGGGNNGTLMNGPVWTNDTAFALPSAPGIIGNTNDGTATDKLWSSGGAWINACRFLAASNMTVATMHAKVAAITGKYKCAIYTDSASQPNRLLRTTGEVTNPTTDSWQTFALTAPQPLTNGNYYWLAIWSDAAAAKAYYSDNSGTLLWQRLDYGAWPDPLVTSDGDVFNYCIYAKGAPVTLVSITVTPAHPTISPGGAQQFTATGTYSDSSTQNLTSQVTWNSSNPSAATINANGLATGVAAGTTTISATLGGVSGNTLLTVQAAPLIIATTSLPDGVTNAAYSAALTATGGTTPYTWSLASGSLPTGLTLNPTSGLISGTPTAPGNFGFTARVTDNAGSNATSGALSINVTAGLPAGTNVLIAFSHTWRYMQTANLDGTTWKQPAYDDSAWPSGPGVLALEDCNCLPQPIRTTLTLYTNRIAHYFRTHFTFAGSTSGLSLVLSNLFDNGGVLYLNGAELGRIRMPAGPITDSTPATEGVGNATNYDMVTVSGSLLTNLVQGDNVLAAEVHQADYESSDVVFGCSLSAVGASAPAGSVGLLFDGVNDLVTLGAAPSLGVTNFTLECWFKQQGTGKRANTGTSGIYALPLVTKGMAENEAGATNMNFFLGIGTNDAGQAVLAADFEDLSNGLNHPIRGATPIASNAWQHAAVTYHAASGNWALYLNGAAYAAATVSGTGAVLVPRYDSLQHAALGSCLRTGGATNADTGFFAGTLDEVRIWNIVRTPQEIANAHNLQIANSAPGLIARWSLDDSAGTTATNSVAGGIAGTLVNGPLWADGYPFPAAPVNLPPAAPTATMPTNGASGLALSPTLAVTVSDPETNTLTVTFYGRLAGGGAVGEDFTFVALPDTQNYSASASGGSPAVFTNQTQWIVSNRAARNIPYVAHLGDTVNDGDNNGNDIQWQAATNAMYRLGDALITSLPDGIPYGVAVGNHDQSPLYDPNGTTTFFNQYFGTNYFRGRGYYGGNYGTNNDNHYDLFSAGGMDFIVVYLEYDAGMTTASPALVWANSLLQTYADRRAIVVSHWIVNTGFNATFSGQGQAIYDGLKANTNLFLMLCGHVPGEGQRTNTYQGRIVWSLLSDYQGRTAGGNGWLRLYEFSPNNNVIHVKTYSPWLDQWETDADSQFDIPYAMAPATPFTVIGTSTGVASGASATVLWTNLLPNAQYEWYVTVSDGVNTTTGPVSSFTTGAGVPQPPQISDQADSQTVQCGNNATVAVVVNSSTTPSYQWYFGATALAGRTSATLQLTSVSEADEGTYRVIVQNSAGSVTSAPAVLTVVDTNAPIITSYPTNTILNANASCQAAIPDLAAQVIASDSCGGVTVTQLPLAGSTVGRGVFPVILTVRDAANNQVTRNATVTVVDVTAPTVASYPTNVTVQANTNCQATVPDLTPQVVASDACGGVTITQVPVAGTVVSLGSAVVTLTIKDSDNNQTMCNATLAVVDGVKPVITLQPLSTTNLPGTTATFAVAGVSCSALSYQWMFGTSPLPGAVSPTLTVTNVQATQAGNYTVILANAAGSTTSAAAVLTVPSAMAPTLAAAPVILPNGHFSVGFSGTPNVAYTIKCAPEATGPWETLTNLTASPTGFMGVEDLTTPAPPARFYRAVYP